MAMNLNKYMHPRNKYKNKKPNFLELALKYPDFRKQVTQDDSGKVFLDFKNADALRALTTCLLKEDFSLTVHLPSDRLVPTLPLRLNYLHWLEDIVGGGEGKWGVDVGTGASCVYPLLGKTVQDWNFLATEADPENFYHAKQNVETNNLQQSIHVKQVSVEDIILEPVESFKDVDKFAFCMCNPPFFADHMEAQAVTTSRSVDRAEAHSVSTASPQECIAKGGEVGFIRQMMEESTILKDKIRVYSSMVGKKVSLVQLKEELRQLKVPKFATTDFCQGKTMRWGIAWSFDESINFPKSQFEGGKKERKPIQYVIPQGSGGVGYNVHSLAGFLKDALTSIKVHCYQGKLAKSYTSITLTAQENTWCHQRRHRRQKKREEKKEATKRTETTDLDSLEDSEGGNFNSKSFDPGTETKQDDGSQQETVKNDVMEICNQNESCDNDRISLEKKEIFGRKRKLSSEDEDLLQESLKSAAKTMRAESPKKKLDGVVGETESPKKQSDDVVGETESPKKQSDGVVGETESPKKQSNGVVGETESPKKQSNGVVGETESPKKQSNGVVGETECSKKQSNGVVGETESPKKQSNGVVGETESPKKQSNGVVGETECSKKQSNGVVGETESPKKQSNGVVGETESPKKQSDGVVGETESPKKQSDGVVGETESPKKQSDDVVGETESPKKQSDGVVGETESPKKQSNGVVGETESPKKQSNGVVGETESPKKQSNGVVGETECSKKQSNGVVGETESPKKQSNGVVGETESPKKQSDGVVGETESPKKQSDGVVGETESPKEYILKCVLRLKRAGDASIHMELEWLGGTSRELLHQVKTFLINKLGEHERAWMFE